ncbi:MAG: nucleotidyltransferase family protein [Peptococcaceae bacterium]|nr:nucleotidyltransferase family protein [Peptococcaceae bacterium]
MIAAVVLAAGTSSRLGTPKQLLAYRGRPLLAAAVENLLRSPVDQVAVVLGHMAEEAAGALEGLPVKVVYNRAYASGQASSLKAGLAALDGTVEGVLFVLGDQPLVKPGTISLLIEKFRAAGGIVAPFYEGKRGNPVLFGRQFFTVIGSLEGDTGAREIIGKHPESLHRVDVSDPGVLFDIDTPEDYRRLLEMAGDQE